MAAPQCESRIQSLPFQYVIFWSPAILFHPLISAFLGKIDKDISDGQHIFSSLPRSHPLRPALLSTLADLQFWRYMLSDDKVWWKTS